MAKTTSQIVAENKRKRAKEREAENQRKQQSAGTRREEAAASRQRPPASNSGKQTGRRQTYQEERNSGTGGSGKSRYYLENQNLGSLAGDQGKAYIQELKAKRERSRLDSEEANYLYQQLENNFPWKDNGDHLQEAREKIEEYNNSDVWEPYPDSYLFEKSKDDLFAEREWLDYVEKYTGKEYRDNFWGQSHANYDMGRLSQDSSKAWNDYLDNPTEESRRKAETIDQLMNEVQRNNLDVYADDGTLPWLSKTLASYIPQFIDQTEYKIGSGLVGGAAGYVVAGPVGAKHGAKAGIVAGSGVYSYKTMRGAAFKNLLEAGVPEETARVAANDEAFISTLIEMGDTALDLVVKGGGKLVNTVSAGSIDAMQGQIIKTLGKNKFTEFVTGLGKYGINIGSESLEEALQECVSIANLNNPGAGKWQLTKDAAEILWDVITNSESEYREQVLGSAKEGGKLATLLGGGEILTNKVLTNTVTNYKVGQIYGRDSQALIQEALEINPDSALANKLQESLDNGKKISGGDLKRLILENEKAIASMDSSSIESSAEQKTNETDNSGNNSWRNAAEYAREGDLNAMDALDRAGLQGSEALAKYNPQAYAQSFQEALQNGASYDQALMKATANSTMGIIKGQVSLDVLLNSVEGDPRKAVQAIGDILAQSGIEMTPGELNLLGIVAAEASAYQRDPSFQQAVAIEMLKENSQEKAWTAASETLWQEATDRVIAHGIADSISRDIGQRRLAEAVDTEADAPTSVEPGETQNNVNPETNSAESDDTLPLKNAAGHEIIKVTKTLLTGKPGSITQYATSKGGIERNYYGDDGRQYKQVASCHHGHPKQHPYGVHGEHAHDYTYDENGKLIGRVTRELTDLERKENADILWPN